MMQAMECGNISWENLELNKSCKRGLNSNQDIVQREKGLACSDERCETPGYKRPSVIKSCPKGPQMNCFQATVILCWKNEYQKLPEYACWYARFWAVRPAPDER